MSLIAEAAVFLAAAIVVVPLFRRLGLGDVLGFLCAGLLIGPSGLAVIDDPDDVLHFAELGVVFLLFVIGLELQPARLWVFRNLMFGLGTLQLLITNAVFAGIARLMGLEWSAAIVIGGALALSSTAFVLQLMGEEKELLLPHGRAAFGVLLLQDIAVIPLLALMRMLSAEEGVVFDAEDVGEVMVLLVKFGLAVIIGRSLLRYLLRAIASLRHQQMFLATALFMIVGSGLLFEELGLSMGLGAFTAGVLLADSEFRHQLETDIIPFKGLLLGLFFMAVGMSANVGVLESNLSAVLFVVFCLVFVKLLILLPLGYLFALRGSNAFRLGLLLAQGGEFAFVILTPALSRGLIDETLYDTLVLAVTISMVCTPLLFMAEARWRNRGGKASVNQPFDTIDAGEPRIIIAGFGRVGQIIARVLNARGIHFVALDKNPDQVAFVRRYGNEVFYGDVAHPELLRTAGIENAEIFICAISDRQLSVQLAEYIQREYPQVKFYGRARDREHALALRGAGAVVYMRDTLLSSLHMAEQILTGLGFSSAQAKRTIRVFRAHDEQTLEKQFAVRHDDEAVFRAGKEANEQLKYLFEEDRK